MLSSDTKSGQKTKKLKSSKKIKKKEINSHAKTKKYKKKKETKNKKAETKLKNQETFDIIDSILEGKELNCYCNDYKIGATTLYKVMKQNHTLHSVHKRYENKTANKHQGNCGESFFLKKSNPKNIIAVETTSPLTELPLIVSQCDFIIKENNQLKLIEVKTSKAEFNGLDPKIIFQIWTTLDCNRMETAEIYHYVIEKYNVSKHGKIEGLFYQKKSRNTAKKLAKLQTERPNNLTLPRKFQSHSEAYDISCGNVNPKQKNVNKELYSGRPVSRRAQIVKKKLDKDVQIEPTRYVVRSSQKFKIIKKIPFFKIKMAIDLFVLGYINFFETYAEGHSLKFNKEHKIYLETKMIEKLKKIKLSDHKAKKNTLKSRTAFIKKNVLNEDKKISPCVKLASYLKSSGNVSNMIFWDNKINTDYGKMTKFSNDKERRLKKLWSLSDDIFEDPRNKTIEIEGELTKQIILDEKQGNLLIDIILKKLNTKKSPGYMNAVLTKKPKQKLTDIKDKKTDKNPNHGNMDVINNVIKQERNLLGYSVDNRKIYLKTFMTTMSVLKKKRISIFSKEFKKKFTKHSEKLKRRFLNDQTREEKRRKIKMNK